MAASRNRKDAAAPRQPDAGANSRLAWLVERHSQSEIARKTGTPVANVHRYLNGARMPAEFCGALVKGLGVNPSWLLTGEGTPYLADVTAGDARMAGDLLALVEAMNAVSQLRLGSLTGKRHLQVLNDLNEALKRHDELRLKLDGQTRPVFTKLIHDLAQALGKRDLDQAEVLVKAAEQVSRLSGDEALQLDFEHLHSTYLYYTESFERSIELDRSNLMRRLARGTAFADPVAVAGYNVVMGMRTYGLVEEARSICRALLGLYRDYKTRHDVLSRLHALMAMLELDMDNPAGAWEALLPIVPGIGAMLGGPHSILLSRALLYMGAVSPQVALNLGPPNPGKMRMMLRFACWLEDEASLREVAGAAIGPERPNQLAAGDYDATHAQGLLAAWDKRGAAALGDFIARQEKSVAFAQNRQVRAFEFAVARCQVARIAGVRPRALELLAESERLRGAIGEQFRATLEVRATHARNGLLLLAPEDKQYKRAAEFFRDMNQRGFGCFAPIVATLEQR